MLGSIMSTRPPSRPSCRSRPNMQRGAARRRAQARRHRRPRRRRPHRRRRSRHPADAGGKASQPGKASEAVKRSDSQSSSIAAAGCVHGPPPIDGAPRGPAKFERVVAAVVERRRRGGARAGRIAGIVAPRRDLARLTLPRVVDLALRNSPATRSLIHPGRAAADVYGST